MKTDNHHPILFFDGVCGLCNAFVDFVVARDRDRVFRFSPLQGELAKKALAPELTKNLNSVVLKDGERVWTKSDAALRVFKKLGGGWSVLGSFGWMPKVIRDSAYDLVAKNRYRLFGKKETCRIPSSEERSLFVD